MINWTCYEPGNGEILEEEAAASLHNHCSMIEQRQSELHEGYLLYGQLYYNRIISSMTWGSEVDEGTLGPVSRQSENLIQNGIDTFHAALTRNKVKVVFQTNDASYELHRRAVQQGRWMAGIMREQGYKIHSEVTLDKLIFGLGAAKVEVVNRDGKNRVQLTRIFPDDLIVDQRECHGGAMPIHWFHRRAIPLESAVALYGLDRDGADIAAARNYAEYRPKGSDYMIIIEGWKLASYDMEGNLVPGYHMMATYNKVLYCEEYRSTTPPIVWDKWRPQTSGFFVPGHAEEALPYQMRLNEINEVVRESQDIMIRPRLLVPSSTKLSINSIDNEIAKILNYTPGAEPKALTWNALNAELYNERDRVVKAYYEFAALSQLAAQAKLPAGARFDSSLAVREFTATSDGRHAVKYASSEEFIMNLAKKILEVCHNEGVKVEVECDTYGGNYRTEVIDFSSKKSYDPESSYLHLAPASLLNETPAARRELLLDMLNRGIITQERYSYLSETDDLNSEAAAQAESDAYIDYVIEKLEEGEYIAPDEFSDLAGGIHRVQRRWLRLQRLEDVPEEVKDVFLRWLLTAKAQIDAASDAMAAKQMMQNAPDQGMVPGQ